MIVRMVERVKRAALVDKIIVAMADPDSLGLYDSLMADNEIEVFVGSQDDVLDRYYQAAKSLNLKTGDYIVRLTADCPLIDPVIIDMVVDMHFDSQKRANIYTSNVHPATFPDGQDVEVFTFEALEDAWHQAKTPIDREHVTGWIFRAAENPANLVCWRDYSSLRLTVDYPEDYDVVAQVYDALYPANPAFGMMDVIKFLSQHPEIRKLNSKYRRNVKA
jgi:spore coat polysaccharide biosynthesis protein SpsF